LTRVSFTTQLEAVHSSSSILGRVSLPACGTRQGARVEYTMLIQPQLTWSR